MGETNVTEAVRRTVDVIRQVQYGSENSRQTLENRRCGELIEATQHVFTGIDQRFLYVKNNLFSRQLNRHRSYLQCFFILLVDR
jgi:hypothetical protein